MTKSHVQEDNLRVLFLKSPFRTPNSVSKTWSEPAPVSKAEVTNGKAVLMLQELMFKGPLIRNRDKYLQ